MMTRPRLLVVQPEEVAPIGLFESWLARLDVDCDVLSPEDGRAVPSALNDHVGLIVTGGRMGANDDADHRWMLPVKALIASTIGGGRPYLGICLGHQLATVALGGQVVPNPHGPTAALIPWGPNAAGEQDELMGVLPAGTPVLHHNNDVAVRLPEGVLPLAHAADGTIQAARFAPRAWGVQFHPEVDAGIIAQWPTGPEDTAAREVTEQLHQYQDTLHPLWEQVARRFARLALHT